MTYTLWEQKSAFEFPILNRIDAKILIEEFRRQYNEVRPHSSLGQLTPVEFKQTLSQPDPDDAIFQA